MDPGESILPRVVVKDVEELIGGSGRVREGAPCHAQDHGQ